jgi:hypothetical protein
MGQGSRELVFCSASGASNRVDNEALGRSHTRSDDGTAVTTLVISVAVAPEQRFNKLGRAVISPLDGGRVTFSEMIGIEPAPSEPRELVFADYTLMPVQLALNPVLENAGRFGKQANDLEASGAGAALAQIGQKSHGLANRKLVLC